MMIFNHTLFIVIGIIFIIFTTITFIFSSLTILIIIFTWKTQCRSITNLLACNSSAALVFYVIAISIQIPFLFQTEQEQTNLTFCKIRAYIYVFACAVKSLSYLVQAISRWFITMDYKHRILLKLRTNMLIIVLSWIISLIVSSCLLFSSKAYQYEPESRLCVLTSKVFLTSFIPAVILFFVPLCTIILLYGIILWHTTRIHRAHPNGLTEMTSRRNIQVYQNILILLGIVIVGGTPYGLAVILNGITEAPQFLYPISVIFISMMAASESLAIFFTNQQVKKLLYNKISCHRTRKIAVII